jgi:uncharacterized membrane protein HdeD (DUF308 family)
MDRWSLIGVGLFGAIFALFTFFRIESTDSLAVRVGIAAFMFGVYGAIVAFGTAGRTRSLSLFDQTLLGVTLALAIAAVFNASIEGFLLALVLGVLLGFTADRWVDHVQLP